MNRLELPSEPMTIPTQSVQWEAPVHQSPFRVVGVRQRESTSGNAATYSPIHYEDRYAYPLLVWLHGSDQDPRCLSDAMSHISTRNYVATAPLGITGSKTGKKPWLQTPESIAESQQRIVEAITQAKRRFYIHPERIFLVGFDAGGTMALRVALQSPELFAGVASLGGPLPTGHCPLRRVNAIRELPLLLSAARKSCQYSDKQVCADLRLLHSAGAMVSLRQYPGKDDLTTQMLADLDRWMMEIVGQSSAAIVH